MTSSMKIAKRSFTTISWCANFQRCRRMSFFPELYMQELTDPAGHQKHVVVDGQQRIRAVLSFLAGEFELDPESPKWPNLGFDDLVNEDRKKIFHYNFVVRQLPEMPEDELLSRTLHAGIDGPGRTSKARGCRRATAHTRSSLFSRGRVRAGP